MERYLMLPDPTDEEREAAIEMQEYYLGNYLKIVRTHREMTLDEAAKISGIARARITALEQNMAKRSILHYEVLAFARAYKISEETLIKMACGLYSFKQH